MKTKNIEKLNVQIEVLPFRNYNKKYGYTYNNMTASCGERYIYFNLTKTQNEEVMSCCNVGDVICEEGYMEKTGFFKVTKMMLD